jgi:hypothetical protein
MTTIKKVALVAAVILCVLIPAGAISAGAATVTSEAAYKAATDNDPHLPLTSEQQRMLELKDQLIANTAAGKTSSTATKSILGALGVRSASTLAAISTTASGMPLSASLTKNQTPQKTSYWCGPATVHEALGQLHREYSQAVLAEELGTTASGGTAWSGGSTSTGHPVPDVMNKHQPYFYVPVEVSAIPGDDEVETYKARMTADIGMVSAPVIGNAWTTPYSDFWLVGHPRTGTVRHWFDIYGYRISNGTTYTKYEDSVHDVSPGLVAWAGAVPAYSEIPSHQIVHIVGGRGYVW